MHRNVARDAVEIVERELDAGAAGHGDQMDDRIGRAAERHLHDERILEGGAREEVARLQVLADHLDDPPTAGASPCGHAPEFGGRDGGGAGQRHAERLGERRHRRGRAHHHAGAKAPRDAGLHRRAIRPSEIEPGLLVRPVFPDVAARAEHACRA